MKELKIRIHIVTTGCGCMCISTIYILLYIWSMDRGQIKFRSSLYFRWCSPISIGARLFPYAREQTMKKSWELFTCNILKFYYGFEKITKEGKLRGLGCNFLKFYSSLSNYLECQTCREVSVPLVCFVCFPENTLNQVEPPTWLLDDFTNVAPHPHIECFFCLCL